MEPDDEMLKQYILWLLLTAAFDLHRLSLFVEKSASLDPSGKE